jgi:hypothetical protein
MCLYFQVQVMRLQVNFQKFATTLLNFTTACTFLNFTVNLQFTSPSILLNLHQGLCMGFSLISAAEILYHCCVNLCKDEEEETEVLKSKSDYYFRFIISGLTFQVLSFQVNPFCSIISCLSFPVSSFSVC